MPSPRIIVLTAPSGAGKTTIARRLLAEVPGLRFSVSATTRPPRDHERHGVDYFFLSQEAFEQHLAAGALLEYEEVYPGRYYGTLVSEVERATPEAPVLLDIEVRGAANVKRRFDGDALTIFVQPPSLEALEARLRARQTESEEALRDRLARAQMELEQAPHFDHLVVNDDLETAVAETLRLVQAFVAS